MNTTTPAETTSHLLDATPASATAAVQLRVFGIGGAGLRLLDALHRSGVDPAQTVAVDTDAQALAASAAALKLGVGGREGRGRPPGDDPVRARAAAEEDLAKLSDACRGVEVVLLLTGLGGGAGTGISPVLAQAASNAGALVLACAVTPFDFMGSHRQQQARLGLAHLRAAADVVVVLSNQHIVRLLDERLGLSQVCQAANDLFVRDLHGLLGLLTQRGLIPIHLNKLRDLLCGRHAEAVLACAGGSGPERARELVDRLFAHPLLEGGQVLRAADSVIVNLRGGADLCVAEVKGIMAQLNERCEGTEVLMGAAVDGALADQLEVTLMATRRNGRAASAASQADAESVSGEGLLGEVSGRAFQPGEERSDRGHTRLVPPAPDLPPERIEQHLARQHGGRKLVNRLQQGTLPLQAVPKGRFEKTEPNIHRGENLDLPTYMRRGLVLN